MNKGFAALCLTTWLRRHTGKNKGGKMKQLARKPHSFRPSSARLHPDYMERKTRLELATLALARRCSTTELLPLGRRSGPACAPPTDLLHFLSDRMRRFPTNIGIHLVKDQNRDLVHSCQHRFQREHHPRQLTGRCDAAQRMW